MCFTAEWVARCYLVLIKVLPYGLTLCVCGISRCNIKRGMFTHRQETQGHSKDRFDRFSPFSPLIKTSVPPPSLHTDALVKGTLSRKMPAELRNKAHVKCSREPTRCRSALSGGGCDRCVELPKSCMRPLPWRNENKTARENPTAFTLWSLKLPH